MKTAEQIFMDELIDIRNGIDAYLEKKQSQPVGDGMRWVKATPETFENEDWQWNHYRYAQDKVKLEAYDWEAKDGYLQKLGGTGILPFSQIEWLEENVKPVEDVHAKSLELLKTIPKEEIQALIQKHQANDPNGVTFSEYLENMPPLKPIIKNQPVEGETITGVEEAAEQYADDNYEYVRKIEEYNTAGDLIKGFLAGAEWQAQQANPNKQ